MKISVYGSAEEERKEVMLAAYQIGELIAGRGHSVITGASTGVPYEAVKGATSKRGEVIGFSPSTSLEEHRKSGLPTEGFTSFVFVPKTYEHADDIVICRKYRNISSVVACDAALFISGQYGTLNEFTIAYELQKPIGVLTGSGGVADLLQNITEKVRKEPRPPIVFSNDPEELMHEIEKCCSALQS